MRKRKILCRSIILVTFQILCFLNVACSNPKIRAGDVSKIITTSGNTEVEITISENPGDKDIFLEAESKVSKFVVAYDFEYIEPVEVVFGDISQEYIYGCQQDNIIYIDNTRSKEEMLSTLVHELLHLQNPSGLDSETEFGTIGHNLTEAVVEKMTAEITSQSETKRTQLLSEWTTENTYQLMCEDYFHKTKLLDDFLNDAQLHKVVYQENEYWVSTTEYFKIAFDKWMIVDNAQTVFGELKNSGEP